MRSSAFSTFEFIACLYVLFLRLSNKNTYTVTVSISAYAFINNFHIQMKDQGKVYL